MTDISESGIGRRRLLLSAGSLAALPLVGGAAAANAQLASHGGARTLDARTDGASPSTGASAIGRRRLGKLEVSSIGLGVQNNSRKYTTETPYRPEQIALIRTAFDHGVTFFDCAEAYGPHECERILGEAIQPFRDQVAITSKFWREQLGQAMKLMPRERSRRLLSMS